MQNPVCRKGAAEEGVTQECRTEVNSADIKG